MKIVGYGICGPGEAKRYMQATLDEFKRLCDDTIILLNNGTDAERKLIAKYGFKIVEDDREWGKMQWKIKQDFLKNHVAKLNPDFCVCLDMDEVFGGGITKQWIQEAPLDAYHVFVVDIWNDPEHYKPESCFWNVRLFRWNGDVTFKQKPVHCGLAPQWAYFYHRFAPFILKHYGLMKREDRMKKVARYQKYDPTATHMDRKFYKMLESDVAKPFDEQKLCDTISKEVATYQQTKPRTMLQTRKNKRYAYVKNPHGVVVDIPEEHLQETLKRKGFTFLNWADEQEKEMEEIFGDENVETPKPETNKGSYQRSTESIQKEADQIDKPESEMAAQPRKRAGRLARSGRQIKRSSMKK